ncbi:cytochrome C oxidase subunit IV family protein [Bradyrhizobium monzae]|uniref:cytochrome C oxidase subunit IV family protein n=1 Tax=Bradyrhizobium sp. Oc8 TaxID=2876780 RepID=UPI001F3EB204|nr:cytochrome C oxidase subunit IV family protein [Bradyrhizobium sp. Oc8]
MMNRHPLEIALAVLLGLAIATLLASWQLMAGPLATAVVLGLAALKGRRILLDFLGLRTAPSVWRGLVTAWVFAVVSFAWAASAARLFI